MELGLDSVAAASPVELLVDGFHFFSEKVNLNEGTHFVVKRFHLQVTQDNVREILAELVRMCQHFLRGVDA